MLLKYSNSSAVLKQIVELVPPFLNIIVLEYPVTKWLTFIWNNLFYTAYHDGMDYFIQSNDDLVFLKEGWLSSSVKMLPVSSYGVLGLNDVKFDCRIYTQSMVNRNHYKVFEGLYFPLKLKNWYSDDWITSVYPKILSACNSDAQIRNIFTENTTRYKACDMNFFEPELINGREKFNHFNQSI